MIKRFNEYNKLFETEDFLLKVDVENTNQEFINELIDKLSFVYKKRKDRYVRPVNVAGRTNDGNIKLDILLSNKDKIEIRYKNNDELKIKVNDDTLYHMDDIKIENVISKTHNIYSKYLKDNNFNISKKDNPFESYILLEDYGDENKNTAKLIRTDQDFWMAVFEVGVGYIIKTYTYEEAEEGDFQPSYFMSPDIVEKFIDGLYDIFWVNEYEIQGKLENVRTEDIDEIKSEIEKQIKFYKEKPTFNTIYLKNKNMYEKRYNNKIF